MQGVSVRVPETHTYEGVKAGVWESEKVTDLFAKEDSANLLGRGRDGPSEVSHVRVTSERDSAVNL